MWDCNILSCLIAQITPRLKLIFGIRCSAVKAEQYGYISYYLSKLEFFVSSLADCLISNSSDGIKIYNYNVNMSKKCTVVYNGIDTNIFKYDQILRNKKRSLWGIKKGEKVIGMLARIDPMKGHQNFIEAAISICKINSNTKFICVGRFHDQKLYENLIYLVNKENLGDRIKFYEESNDPAKILSAFDVFCSPSIYGEGFSNSIAEAMSCGRNCVVTDVGESRNIVFDKNMICNAQDVRSLSSNLELCLKYNSYNKYNRDHIIKNFNLINLEKKTFSIFLKLCDS